MTNEKLIDHFYTCFQNKDIAGMQNCYADHATFSDAVFRNLDAAQVRSMWAMLLKSGKDLRLEYSHVKADGHKGSANWVAWYTFSATGNKVVNKVSASFVIENEKIVTHHDNFNFYSWARQALGLTGLLLGWTPFLRNKIRKKAANNLRLYRSEHKTI